MFRASDTKEVAYKLKLPEELQGIHNTFHVSNLRKCLADESPKVTLKNVKSTVLFIAASSTFIGKAFAHPVPKFCCYGFILDDWLSEWFSIRQRLSAVTANTPPFMSTVISAELGRSSSSAPEKGKVSIYIDCSPTAAPQFEV
ncbi:hypothetical protein OSB04_031513 [Centaurea solstitialis]|uniref:Tf2-1-like SH3-like domain-containing protein n=1 Tax=Centaurea solstitialis TaxID=347529 RepID=A0AA38SMA7_9ASTR|nr:hypothetical protein OSB04_031513 [Centaurea solstitialis]